LGKNFLYTNHKEHHYPSTYYHLSVLQITLREKSNKASSVSSHPNLDGKAYWHRFRKPSTFPPRCQRAIQNKHNIQLHNTGSRGLQMQSIFP